jgi:alpha-aminoadipate carrier protein LysW
MTNLECLECGAALNPTRPVVLHEILPCGDCGAELEVVSVNPPAVEAAPEIEEDWGE